MQIGMAPYYKHWSYMHTCMATIADSCFIHRIPIAYNWLCDSWYQHFHFLHFDIIMQEEEVQ